MIINFVIIATITLVGFLAGAAIGAWTAEVIHGWRYLDPDWANLDPAICGLFGALFTLPSLELGRWVVAIRARKETAPVGSQWLVGVAKALVRLATAAIGLGLGFEAGAWTALIWSKWGSTAQYAAEAHREFSNVWIGAAGVWGGALAIFGYFHGRRVPPVASFVGAYVSLHAVPFVLPTVIGLYWGSFPSSDVHAFVLTVSHFLTTSVLVLVFAVTGYWLGRWSERLCPVLRAS